MKLNFSTLFGGGLKTGGEQLVAEQEVKEPVENVAPAAVEPAAEPAAADPVTPEEDDDETDPEDKPQDYGCAVQTMVKGERDRCLAVMSHESFVGREALARELLATDLASDAIIKALSASPSAKSKGLAAAMNTIPNPNLGTGALPSEDVVRAAVSWDRTVDKSNARFLRK